MFLPREPGWMRERMVISDDELWQESEEAFLAEQSLLPRNNCTMLGLDVLIATQI